MNKLLIGFVIFCLGLGGGYFVQPFVSKQLQLAGFGKSDSAEGEKKSERKILYWVAPMDANYRRDKPGKSPMGMDLVPVYEDEATQEGVVKISPEEQNNFGVRITTVKKGRLNREITTVGYISFDEEKMSHVHTRVNGWIEKLIVKAEGDPIKKGQKLFEIYSPELVNAQEEYITALKSQNKILIKASKSRLISLGLGYGQIRNLDKTRKVRQRIAYYARQNGFVANLKVREGMYVKPNMDVMTIAQLDTVWVIAEVFEKQSGWVKPGQTVDMFVSAYPQHSYKGLVDFIYPTLDAKTRTLKVRIRFNNPDHQLKPNMFANLTIHGDTDQTALLLKREAIIRNGQMERVVKYLGEGKFLSVAVKTGDESGDEVEILKGLQEGDKVVTSAQFLIDSESSLTASFQRMEPSNLSADQDEATQSSADKAPDQAWMHGEIKNVMAAHQMLTIAHQPVDEWGWPAMVMDFPVYKAIPINRLTAGKSIDFLVRKNEDGSIEIIQIKGIEAAPVNADNRMNTGEERTQTRQPVWVNGKVLSIEADNHRLEIHHEAIPEWGEAAMDMILPLNDELSLDTIQLNQSYRFQFQENTEGVVVIQALEAQNSHKSHASAEGK